MTEYNINISDTDDESPTKDDSSFLSKQAKIDKYIRDLDRLLKNYEVGKGEAHTHTTFGGTYKRYNIPDRTYDKFIKLYSKVCKYKQYYLVERPMEYGPLLIDIDFHLKTKKRQYTKDTIKLVVSTTTEIMKKYYRFTDPKPKALVTEKPKPSKFDNKDEYKDGFHVIYPGSYHMNIRELIIQELCSTIKREDGFKNIPYSNSKFDDIFDLRVVKSNGFMMYGSRKENGQLYHLTYIIDSQGNEITLDDDVYSEIKLPRIMSNRIRTADEQPQIRKSAKEELNAKLERNKVKLNKEHKEKPEKSPVPQAKLMTAPKDAIYNKSDAEIARKLLKILKDERADDYTMWTQVGWALHNISYDLLDDFIEFSKHCSEKFDKAGCMNLWNKARNGGLTIASLHMWAKLDNKKEYSNILFDSNKHLLDTLDTLEHYDIAKYVYSKYKYQFRCSGIQKRKWWEYQGHRWVELDGARTLSILLSEEVSKDIARLENIANVNMMNNEGHPNNAYFQHKNKLNAVAGKLRKSEFKGSVITECANLFYEFGFFDKLDSKINLMGFDNGVYDFNMNTFRSGSPDDYITYTTGYDYPIDMNMQNPYVQEMDHYFNTVMTDPEMKKYLLTWVASMLTGELAEEEFSIWTGSGGNGKGKTIYLIQKALGNYQCTMDVATFTQKRKDAGSASPHLAILKGVRFAPMQEPEGSDVIMVGFMKGLTGGDIIIARKLNSDPFQFKPQCKIVLACNDLPNIPSNDQGTWRRIKNVYWGSEFRPKDKIDSTKKNQFEIDTKLPQKMENWYKLFIWYIIENYMPIYRKYGLVEPAQVIEHTKQYQADCNLVLDFMKINYDKVDKHNEELKIVYENYKSWVKEYHSATPMPKKKFMNNLKDIKYEFNEKKVFNIQFKDEIDDGKDSDTEVSISSKKN